MTSIFSTLFRRSEKRQAYAALLNLDDHMLRDIGLSRGDINHMARGRRGSTRTLSHE